MPERAERIGTRVNVSSRSTAGTEVDLSWQVAFRLECQLLRCGWRNLLEERRVFDARGHRDDARISGRHVTAIDERVFQFGIRRSF